MTDDVHPPPSGQAAYQVGPPSRDPQGRIARLESTVASLTRKNETLVKALGDSKAQLLALKAQVDQLAGPPSTYGQVLAPHPDGTVDVISGGRKLRVGISPEVDAGQLTAGREVRLNEALAVVETTRYEEVGQVVTVHETLPGDAERLVVVLHGEEHRVVRRAGSLSGQHLRQGDLVMLDPRTGFAFEVIPKAEVEDLLLEEVPDISYADIGGLAGQIEAIRDAIELPYLHPELFAEHRLRAPKGVLLYGPPGCGKTLVAKAVAASLARQVAELRGASAHTSYFLNVKGPELLNKYVGETERQIRLIFQRAREHASGGMPVVVFFDEMDSLFRTRGSGLSSDVETTIVPQLLAEIDGVERLDNVIVIGASNREDMIDPAILRPGRLDAKIKIDRPDEPSARDIFGKYLTSDLPLHADELSAHGGDPQATVAAMIDTVVARMYARTPENRYLELITSSGGREVLYFADLASGAMITNVVDRAKRMAIKELLATGERGLRTSQLMRAYRAEFTENEDLPNTTNPDDWMRVSGRKQDRVLEIRKLASQEAPGQPGPAPTPGPAAGRPGRHIDDVEVRTTAL